MTFLLLMAGAIVNAIQFVFVGGAVIIGFVFFLIGLPSSKSKKKRFTRDTIKFILTVFSTLFTLIVYMVITFWNVRTGGILAFSGSYSTDVYVAHAKSLVLFGVIQGAFSILAFKWMLPLIIGKLGLGTKHKWAIVSGSLLTIAGGSVAWLMSV